MSLTKPNNRYSPHWPNQNTALLLKIESAFMNLRKCSNKSESELLKIVDKKCIEFEITTLSMKLELLESLWEKVMLGDNLE